MKSTDGVRWATREDDAALRRICARTPIHGPLSYCLEREPDFFALTRLQGDHGGRVAVIDAGGEIAAMAMVATFRAWVGGAEQRCAYVGDLKVAPDHRRKGLSSRVVRFLAQAMQQQDIDRMVFLVLAGNPAADLIDKSHGLFEVRKLRTVRNFLIPFGASMRTQPDAVIGRASPESSPEMIALWNRVQRGRAFAPVLDEQLLLHWRKGLRSLDDTRVVYRNGRLTGFCAVWDASLIKQIRLLRLSTGLRAATGLFNVLATLRGRPRFPRLGQTLRGLYISHVCAESPADLAALLVDVHNQYRESGSLYFDLALDREDPLRVALSAFRPLTSDFELHDARIPMCRPASASPGSEDCVYFDMSLV
jgi:GNAT superfamily N-acetyltransferase